MSKARKGLGTGLALALALLGGSFAASAQTTVVTIPGPLYSGNSSGTVTSGGTFQSVWPAVPSGRLRKSCTVQNNGTHNMYVYFGPIASATDATAVTLAAGQSVSCVAGGGTLQDQVSVDGTTADAFFAAQQ